MRLTRRHLRRLIESVINEENRFDSNTVPVEVGNIINNLKSSGLTVHDLTYFPNQPNALEPKAAAAGKINQAQKGALIQAQKDCIELGYKVELEHTDNTAMIICAEVYEGDKFKAIEDLRGFVIHATADN
tara:strand:+ start:310 stop:699 length:390 start_codon:yes stop_codon:yes gene_type:complete